MNNDLLNCFVTETNRYADEFITEGILEEDPVQMTGSQQTGKK